MPQFPHFGLMMVTDNDINTWMIQGNRSAKLSEVRSLGSTCNPWLMVQHGLQKVTSPPTLPLLLSFSSQHLPRSSSNVAPRSSQPSHGRCVLLFLCCAGFLLALPTCGHARHKPSQNWALNCQVKACCHFHWWIRGALGFLFLLAAKMRCNSGTL